MLTRVVACYSRCQVIGASATVVVQERQELTRQWENAVAQMRRTDDAINAASELFADKRVQLREKQRKLDISAQFLDDQLQTNRDCEALISSLERDLASLRAQYATEQACPCS